MPGDRFVYIPSSLSTQLVTRKYPDICISPLVHRVHTRATILPKLDCICSGLYTEDVNGKKIPLYVYSSQSVWLHIAASAIGHLIHRIGIDVICVGSHASLFLPLFVGYRFPAGWCTGVLDVFGHGELF
jgi:hypothetical protein